MTFAKLVIVSGAETYPVMMVMCVRSMDVNLVLVPTRLQMAALVMTEIRVQAMTPVRVEFAQASQAP